MFHEPCWEALCLCSISDRVFPENLDMFLYRNIFSFILETELVENMVSVFVTFILL